ncbi:MAG TPA: hypothetical protein P5121_21725 [Caldilineaceae bacterium]|nr:hypothetical protein [Caldilineaceae bacterium]
MGLCADSRGGDAGTTRTDACHLHQPRRDPAANDCRRNHQSLCMPLGPLALLLVTIPFLWWLLKADFTQEQATLREFLRDCRVAHEAGTPLVRTMLTIGYDAKRGFYWDHD